MRTAHRDSSASTSRASRGISSAVHYPVPVHLAEAYAALGYEPGSLPVAEEMADQICSLPMFPGLNEMQISAIAAAVGEATDR